MNSIGGQDKDRISWTYWARKKMWGLTSGQRDNPRVKLTISMKIKKTEKEGRRVLKDKMIWEEEEYYDGSIGCPSKQRARSSNNNNNNIRTEPFTRSPMSWGRVARPEEGKRKRNMSWTDVLSMINQNAMKGKRKRRRLEIDGMRSTAFQSTLLGQDQWLMQSLESPLEEARKVHVEPFLAWAMCRVRPASVGAKRDLPVSGWARFRVWTIIWTFRSLPRPEGWMDGWMASFLSLPLLLGRGSTWSSWMCYYRVKKDAIHMALCLTWESEM